MAGQRGQITLHRLPDYFQINFKITIGDDIVYLEVMKTAGSLPELEMKNHFGWPIDPHDLREYLDYNEELKQGIADIIQFLLEEDEAINQKVQAGERPVPRKTSDQSRMEAAG